MTTSILIGLICGFCGAAIVDTWRTRNRGALRRHHERTDPWA